MHTMPLSLVPAKSANKMDGIASNASPVHTKSLPFIAWRTYQVIAKGGRNQGKPHKLPGIDVSSKIDGKGDNEHCSHHASCMVESFPFYPASDYAGHMGMGYRHGHVGVDTVYLFCLTSEQAGGIDLQPGSPAAQLAGLCQTNALTKKMKSCC
eukprot:scaffold56381_cov20-Tisochrysis_lutea.AAC.1